MGYGCMKNIYMVAVLLIFTAGNVSAALINGGFENPVNRFNYQFYDEEAVDGWNSDAADGKIEIWKTGFLGVDAYEGDQFVELNANMEAALYQDVSGINFGDRIDWEFAHRGRRGLDTVRLSITDLGADNQFGTADDSTLFTGDFSTNNDAWVFYSGSLSILALGNDVRFEWDSISSAGGISVGNFLDGAAYGVSHENEPVPEPATLVLFGAGLVGLAGGVLRRGKKKTA